MALIIGFTQQERSLLRLSLQARGYDPVECEDAFTAIGALKEREADALLIDTHTEGLTPWELIPLIHKHRPANYYVVIGNVDTFLAGEDEILKSPNTCDTPAMAMSARAGQSS